MNTHAVVAKAGVDALSAQLAIELGPRGITSNVIAPGPIGGTEGMRRLVDQSTAADITRKIPLGRMGTVEDIGDATVFLFSNAGSFVNGAVLVGEFQSLHIASRKAARDKQETYNDIRSGWWSLEDRRWKRRIRLHIPRSPATRARN